MVHMQSISMQIKYNQNKTIVKSVHATENNMHIINNKKKKKKRNMVESEQGADSLAAEEGGDGEHQ